MPNRKRECQGLNITLYFQIFFPFCNYFSQCFLLNLKKKISNTLILQKKISFACIFYWKTQTSSQFFKKRNTCLNIYIPNKTQKSQLPIKSNRLPSHTRAPGQSINLQYDPVWIFLPSFCLIALWLKFPLLLRTAASLRMLRRAREGLPRGQVT